MFTFLTAHSEWTASANYGNDCGRPRPGLVDWNGGEAAEGGRRTFRIAACMSLTPSGLRRGVSYRQGDEVMAARQLLQSGLTVLSVPESAF